MLMYWLTSKQKFISSSKIRSVEALNLLLDSEDRVHFCLNNWPIDRQYYHDSDTGQYASILGASGSNEFITTVMSILEAISQHPTLLLENHEVVIETVLSTLADLVGSQNGKLLHNNCVSCHKVISRHVHFIVRG